MLSAHEQRVLDATAASLAEDRVLANQLTGGAPLPPATSRPWWRSAVWPPLLMIAFTLALLVPGLVVAAHQGTMTGDGRPAGQSSQVQPFSPPPTP